MANSYADDIKVKISERYKPPCRISMPMSYSQRLTLNKQIQDNRPSYDFNLERCVLEKMVELKEVRRDIAEGRKQRLDQARQEFEKKIEEAKEEKLRKEQAEAKLLEKSSRNDPQSDPRVENLYSNIAEPQARNPANSSQNYITKNGILMPIPAANYSSTSGILNPMPMTSMAFQASQPNVKSFNLSDFESDTSSPFDNMELKSINDLEELAQVLKTDRANFFANTSIYQGYNNTTKTYENSPHSVVDYSQNSRDYNPRSGVTPGSLSYNSYSQINTSYNPISTTVSQYNHPYGSTSNYQVPTGVSNYGNQPNGYLYNIPSQMTSQVQLSHFNNPYNPYRTTAASSMQKTNCKSVPDLVKSLDSTNLNDTSETTRHSISSSYHTTDIKVPTRPKSTDAVYPKTKIKDGTLNPLDRLSKEQREVCKNVSLMGFPLDRVVKVCEIIGCDEKKIVDHLLALSTLLDLGFSERDASEALIKNNNDGDKALDFLIS